MARARQLWNRISALLLAGVLLVGAAGGAAAVGGDAAPVLGIYTTGGMEGRAYAQDPLTGQRVENSYLKVGTAMKAERSAVDAALLLDGGNAVDSGLVGDGGSAVIQALRTIGYDALVPGMAEFRLGTDGMERLGQALRDTRGYGAPLDVLSGTYLDAGTQEPVETPYAVYTLTLGRREIRVGVLGLGPLEVSQALPESFFPQAVFSHGENTASSYVWEWSNFWQSRLEQERCDLVVVVCQADAQTLAKFAAQTTGIDLLVGSMGPAAAARFSNAEGDAVSYVCGGGTALTRTTVTLSGGVPAVGESTLLPLSGYADDPTLAQALSDAYAAAEEEALEPVAELSGDWDGLVPSACEQTDAADLVGEALLWATGADAALITPGGLGAVSLSGPDGVLTLRTCADLAPGDSPVVVVELTAVQLRAYLDACAGLYQVQADGSLSGGADADVLYGLDYALYLGAPAGARVSGLRTEGQAVGDGQVFRVAVEAARLEGSSFSSAPVVWSAGSDPRFAQYGGTAASLLAAYASQTGVLTAVRSSTWAIYTGTQDGPLTRLEFVSMLYDLAGRPQPGADAAFIDASGDAAVWAAETGVVSGDGTGKFLPTQVVTREQAAAMIYNYARFTGASTPATGPSVSGLTDAASISAWARPAVEFCLRTGALSASGGAFQPGGTLTRDEAARCLAALASYLGR